MLLNIVQTCRNEHETPWWRINFTITGPLPLWGVASDSISVSIITWTENTFSTVWNSGIILHHNDLWSLIITVEPTSTPQHCNWHIPYFYCIWFGNQTKKQWKTKSSLPPHQLASACSSLRAWQWWCLALSHPSVYAAPWQAHLWSQDLKMEEQQTSSNQPHAGIYSVKPSIFNRLSTQVPGLAALVTSPRLLFPLQPQLTLTRGSLGIPKPLRYNHSTWFWGCARNTLVGCLPVGRHYHNVTKIQMSWDVRNILRPLNGDSKLIARDACICIKNG